MKDTRQKPKARAKKWRILVLIAVLLLVGGAYAWRRWMRVEPPIPDLTDVEPAVAETIRQARDSVRQSPHSSQAWGQLGATLLAHDFKHQAVYAFAQAESIEKGEPRWPYLQAIALFRENPKQALAPLQRAASLSNGDAAILGTLAETQLALGDTAGAENNFQKLLKDESGMARGRLGLAQIALERGDPTLALRHLQAVVDNPYCRKKANLLLAQVHHRQGDVESATRAAAAAAALPDDRFWPDPYAVDAFDRQAGMFNKLEKAENLRAEGRSSESQQLIHQTEQEHADLYWLLEGRLCLQNGEPRAAIRALRKSVEFSPRFIEARYWLGQAYLESKQHESAEGEFQQVVRLEASYGPAYLGLVKCRLAQGNIEEAIAAAQIAVRYMPSNAAAHRELGRLLIQQGETEQAVLHLKNAIELDPSDQESRELLSSAERE